MEFSTFATRTVIGELKRHFRTGLVDPSSEAGPGALPRARSATESLTQGLGRPPTVSEMAESIGSTEEAVLEAIEAGQSYRILSIDAPDRQDGSISTRLGDMDSGLPVLRTACCWRSRSPT